jgi:formate-dependent nitrite reductase membrane component NrfD
MLNAQRNSSLFQQEWTGKGERGLRDFLLIPAIFFGAVSPGLFLTSLFTGYTAGIWIALIMNFFGYGVTHLLFLGRMERFWRAMLNWRTSWISRGFVFNALFMVFGGGYAVALTGVIPILSVPVIKSALMLLSAVSAVLFAAYPGLMLSTVKAIPFWRSVLEPVIFFLQGLLGGVAMQLILGNRLPFDSESTALLLTANSYLLVAVLALILIAMLMKALHQGIERISVQFLLIGDLSRLFLVGAIGLGLVLPLVTMTFLEPGARTWISTAVMLMELTGIYIAKYGILRAGAYSPIR